MTSPTSLSGRWGSDDSGRQIAAATRALRCRYRSLIGAVEGTSRVQIEIRGPGIEGDEAEGSGRDRGQQFQFYTITP